MVGDAPPASTIGLGGLATMDDDEYRVFKVSLMRQGLAQRTWLARRYGR
jgi:hypothetical protein